MASTDPPAWSGWSFGATAPEARSNDHVGQLAHPINFRFIAGVPLRLDLAARCGVRFEFPEGSTRGIFRRQPHVA
jgi:hypothetical protein